MNTRYRIFRPFALTFAIFQFCGLCEAGATFTVKVTLEGLGTLGYVSQLDGHLGPSGFLERAGTTSFTVEEGSQVDFELSTFGIGSRVERIIDNGVNVTNQLMTGAAKIYFGFCVSPEGFRPRRQKARRRLRPDVVASGKLSGRR